MDLATSEKADAIARLLTRDQADAEQLTTATEVAQAQLELVADPRGPREPDGGGGPDVGQHRTAAALGGIGLLRAVRRHQTPAGIAQALRP
jgi:hypothetical protein